MAECRCFSVNGRFLNRYSGLEFDNGNGQVKVRVRFVVKLMCRVHRPQQTKVREVMREIRTFW